MLAGRGLISAQPSAAAVAASVRPRPRAGGFELLFHVQLGDYLGGAALSPCGRMLAAAGADCVTIVSAKDGTVGISSDELGDDPPNAVDWSTDSAYLVVCSDDGYARVVAVSTGKLVFEHLIADEPEPGKRPRCVASDHATFTNDATCVAAAGRLVHACAVPGGGLSHAVTADAPVCSLCRSPPNLAAHWAYAAGYKGGVLLVSSGGELVSNLSSRGHLRSLTASSRWLAAGGFDGTLELWDMAKRSESAEERREEADKTLKAFCGSDGAALAFSADGGSLALTGKRAAVFDFSGAEPHHPYRSAAFAAAAYRKGRGEPDPVPRVCMGEEAKYLAFAPPCDSNAATTLATAGADGMVQLWRPYNPPLRKGGVGNPAQPERMKPQFYTHLKADVVHPSNDARSPCALIWLSDDTLAVCFGAGDLVAWELEPVTILSSQGVV